MRTKSYARVRKAAKVEAYGTQRREPYRGGDQLLLGDVALEEAVRVFLGEELGTGGVADLTVQGDDVTTAGTEGGERLAVGVPRGDFLPLLPAGQFDVPGRDGVQHAGGGRLVDADVDVAGAAELGDRLVGVRQRLSVQSFTVLY
jgi:hypothetical protein